MLIERARRSNRYLTYLIRIMRLDQRYFNENTMARESKEGIMFRNVRRKQAIELIVGTRQVHENQLNIIVYEYVILHNKNYIIRAFKQSSCNKS